MKNLGKIENPHDIITKQYMESNSILKFDSMPTATSDLLNIIVQYVGTTTTDYTNGYFYKCVADGASYKWQAKNVQAGGAGDYVLKTGDTLTGALTFNMSGDVIKTSGNSITFAGGTSSTDSGSVTAYPKSHATHPGDVVIKSISSSNNAEFIFDSYGQISSKGKKFARNKGWIKSTDVVNDSINGLWYFNYNGIGVAIAYDGTNLIVDGNTILPDDSFSLKGQVFNWFIDDSNNYELTLSTDSQVRMALLAM